MEIQILKKLNQNKIIIIDHNKMHTSISFIILN